LIPRLYSVPSVVFPFTGQTVRGRANAAAGPRD
jgi:hypothetical protein